MSTHIEFSDFPRNGEGLSVYEPDTGLYSTPPPDGTELIFHVGHDAAYLSRADLIELRDLIDGHLLL